MKHVAYKCQFCTDVSPGVDWKDNACPKCSKVWDRSILSTDENLSLIQFTGTSGDGTGPKAKKKDSDEPAYLSFQYCKDKCFVCKQCGYFWATAHKELNGQPAQFTPPYIRNQ